MSTAQEFEQPQQASEKPPRLRPKPAATLIILSGERGKWRVLMGKRSEHHAFMPGKYVFPGGRVERSDYSAAMASDLDPVVAAKLKAGRAGCATHRQARALALAAIRETFEETGYLVGEKAEAAADAARPSNPAWRAFTNAGALPSLSPMRLIARAITPPGRTRRFDARFFAVFEDSVVGRQESLDKELLEPRWLTFEEAYETGLANITRRVLADLAARLDEDPDLQPGAGVPFHFMHYGRRQSEIL
ncbi:NUDIX hydrolase [Afifella sp. YEN Y35]|uniref:NUDIX hydrolase n=1 Tax=Afifella sp. YEN Y35 TaxID=3388337 RepID=UPI0039E07F68